MKAGNWIDRVKIARGWASDYRAAKELGLSRNAISNYRSGTRNTLDEDTALKVAGALGIDPAGIIIDQMSERTKSPEVRSTLAKIAGELYIMLTVRVAITTAQRSRLCAALVF